MATPKSQKEALKRYSKKNNYEKQKEYIKKNMKYITVITPAEDKDAFQKKCKENGDTMNGVLNKRIKEYIKE